MTINLTKLTDEQLTAELKRREDTARPQCPDAKAFKDVDFKGVYDMALEQVAEAKKRGYTDEDDAGYVHEVVMVAVFGSKIWPKIWQWINEGLGQS